MKTIQTMCNATTPADGPQVVFPSDEVSNASTQSHPTHFLCTRYCVIFSDRVTPSTIILKLFQLMFSYQYVCANSAFTWRFDGWISRTNFEIVMTHRVQGDRRYINRLSTSFSFSYTKANQINKGLAFPLPNGNFQAHRRRNAEMRCGRLLPSEQQCVKFNESNAKL